MPSNQINQKLKGLEIVDYDKLSMCTHCGLCLPTCPTYRELETEMDSPRGRLYLIKNVINERLPINSDFGTHIYRCLDCRACETACPSGVHFGEIIEEARAIYELNYKRPLKERVLKKLAFEWLFPHPNRLVFIFWLLWLYQRLGLRLLVQHSGLLKSLGKFGQAESIMPPIPIPLEARKVKEITPPKGERQHRVAFLSGCVMSLIYPKVNLATLRVLAENGCEVITPKSQLCCGALNIHNGVRDVAKQMAKKNIDVFLKLEVEAIIANAAGCGATLKEYGELLKDDPYYAHKAEIFSSKVKDISEFLASIPLKKPSGKVKIKVTYDEPCHLYHGQGIVKEPKRLLELIPGLELIPLNESDWCCGSAGIYNIIQPQLSKSLLERKMDNVSNVAASGAELLVSGNPGCMLQLALGVKKRKLNMKVMHPVELLDMAYQSEGGRRN